MKSNTMPLLGDLEIEVLESLWLLKQASVKEVFEQAGKTRGISLNTIQSTLERLYRKDLLQRSKQGREFIYTPLLSRENLMANLIQDVFGRFGSTPQSSIAAILHTAETLDEATLTCLEQEIKRLKAQG